MRSDGIAARDDTAIAFEGVSKHYSLSLQKEATDFKTMLLHLPRFLSNARRPFVALDDVDLRVRRGESLGHHRAERQRQEHDAARHVAASRRPRRARSRVNGRVSALLELGSGFHPQISGRENAILNAVLLGLTLKEARDMLPEIIEFSELGDFIDQPMRTYSSGMFFRLGFSVAVHVQPEILLHRRSARRRRRRSSRRSAWTTFTRLRRKGVTLVLVTHDMLNLPKFCDRGILLEHGKITDEGTPQQVVHNYLARVEGCSP